MIFEGQIDGWIRFRRSKSIEKICQSKLKEKINLIIIKGYIEGKYTFYAEHEHLVAKICSTECSLEVKRFI